MIFMDGTYVNHWSEGASVPDITRLETQLWIFCMAAAYINAGIEAIHFGQIMLIGRHDPDLTHWWDLLSRVRSYARRHARRGMLLCDAHVSSGVGCYGLPEDASLAPGGFRVGERLLLDFHALPLRIKEIAGKPYQSELAVDYLDALYGRSLGGIAPSGWSCTHLPFLVEFDNWGSSGHGGESVRGWLGPLQGISDRYWIWGYDEICWFAHQSELGTQRLAEVCPAVAHRARPGRPPADARDARPGGPGGKPARILCQHALGGLPGRL